MLILKRRTGSSPTELIAEPSLNALVSGEEFVSRFSLSLTALPFGMLLAAVGMLLATCRDAISDLTAGTLQIQILSGIVCQKGAAR